MNGTDRPASTPGRLRRWRLRAPRERTLIPLDPPPARRPLSPQFCRSTAEAAARPALMPAPRPGWNGCGCRFGGPGRDVAQHDQRRPVPGRPARRGRRYRCRDRGRPGRLGKGEGHSSPSPLSQWGQFPIFTGKSLSGTGRRRSCCPSGGAVRWFLHWRCADCGVPKSVDEKTPSSFTPALRNCSTR